MVLQQDNSEIVDVLPAESGSSIVLVCEHASPYIPTELHALGLSAEPQSSHAAWDPGALAVAKEMASQLGACLVSSKISRLVYDCNRPPEAPEAMREQSEVFDVPGNRGLSLEQRQERTAQYYEPFRAALAAEVARISNPVIVTVHSFTPIYHGQPRAVEIGILHDRDRRLADALLAVADGNNVERNAPYGPEDGVMHTLECHALPGGHMNVMIEVRNDLIADEADQIAMATRLCGWLTKALANLGGEPCKA